MSAPAIAGPTTRATLNALEPERDGVHQVLALDDLGDERLPGRHLERREEPEEDREPHHPVHRDQVQLR